MSARRPRILISHQGCVPIYRRAFYERLARSDAIEYVVAAGEPPKGTDYIVAQPPFSFETLPIRNQNLKFGGKDFVWQALAGRYWSSFDGIVLGEEFKYLSHIPLALISKLRGRPLVWWGFGDAPPPGPIGGAMRQLRNLGAGYLAYTEGGRRTLAASGFDDNAIAVLNNTVDIDQQRALRDAAAGESDAALRAALGVPAGIPVLLYFGRFLPGKHIDVLIRYVQSRRATAQPVAALIFGDGVEKDRLQALAAGAPDIVLHRHDDMQLARALKLCVGLAIPGFVGLAITHGFAHGAPMLTREGVHPPEIEYLRDGVNGLMLPADEAAFFAGLDAYVGDPALQAKLSAGAADAAALLTMDAMASRFDALMQSLLYKSGRLSLATA